MSQQVQSLNPALGAVTPKTTARPKSTWKRIRSFPVFPMFVLAVIVFTGVFSPFLETVFGDPESGNLIESLQPPVFMGGSWEHPLGTDGLGRDELSRLISGARISLLVGISVVLGAGAIGTVLALLSGYFGGIVDAVISRITEVFLAVPFLLVAIAVVGAVGPSVRNLVFVFMFMTWAGYARVLRSEVLRIRASEYVKLARVAGCSNARIIFRHILPNIVNPLVILATLQLGAIIIAEASLSFLGLGVPAPQATWGGMLAGGKDYIGVHDHLTIVPGITIALTCLSINLVGDWLRLRLDPRFRQL
jgi:peptide/nickel transport system permease protein